MRGNACKQLLHAALLCLVWDAAPAQTVVEGRVSLPQRHSAPVLNQRYQIVSKAGVLSINPPVAVVYLEGPFAGPSSPQTATMAQRDLAFQPSILAVQAGTRVEFPNLDDTYHNIFSYSSAKRFDLGRYRSDERPVPSVLFDTPGLITLHCDIHEHMRALILVLNTPYFAMTGADGTFRLAGLPPGPRVLKAWMDSRTTLARPIELREGAVLHVDFP